MEGTWKTDGADAKGKATIAITTNENNRVAILDLEGPRTSPMNLMYEMASSSSSSSSLVMKVELQEFEKGAGLSVGFVRPEEFKSGYRNKGMFYNGNLTNAGAALKTSYGPRPQVNDCFIVEYKEVSDGNTSIQMLIYVNGTLVGKGFEIPQTETSFVPGLIVQGKMVLKTTILNSMPETMNGNNGDDGGTVARRHPLAGDWKIEQASNVAGESILPVESSDTEKEIMLMMKKSNDDDDDTWNVSIKVCNVLSTSIKVTSVSEANDDGSGRYELESRGGVASTKMMAPPPFSSIEQSLSACLQNEWKTIQVSSSALTIFAADGTTALATCGKPEERSLLEAACTSY